MSILFKIKVSGNQVENDYPIDVNIRAKREHIYFRQKVQDNELQLAYLEAPEITSGNSIFLDDYLKKITNRLSDNYFITKDNVVISNSPNLIFTTITTESSFGRAPLFFGHYLPNNATDISFSPWNKDIDPNLYIYDSNSRILASNLFNYFEENRKVYSPSIVQYSLTEVTNGSTAKTGRYNDIFKRQPVYREATFFDIDEETFGLNTSLKIYTKEKLPSGRWKYTIYGKQLDQNLYFKEAEENKTQIKIPPKLNIQSRWPIQSIGNEISFKKSDAIYEYDWGSEDSSAYYPYYPYFSYKEEGRIINENTIAVGNTQVVLEPKRNIHITVKVFRDGTFLFAKTSRPELIGKRLSGSLKDNDLVKYEQFEGGVDYSLGVVSISNSYPIKDTDRVTVEYVSERTTSFKDFGNLNPNQNSLLEKYSLLYYVTLKTATEKSKVHWIAIKKSPNALGFDYTLKVAKTSDPDLAGACGKDLSAVINERFIINPFSMSLLGSNNYMYMPLCLVGFDKSSIVNTTHKDLRVFAGLKEDMKLLNKGKDFAFSNILNAGDTYKLRLEDQIYVWIDKSEIGNNLTKTNSIVDIENIVRANIPVSMSAYILYGDRPTITFAEAIKGPESTDINLKLKNAYYNDIELYLSGSKQERQESDILLSTVTPSVVAVGLNPEAIVSASYSNEIIDPENIDKIYMYIRWKSESGYSDYSPVFCVHTKK